MATHSSSNFLSFKEKSSARRARRIVAAFLILSAVLMSAYAALSLYIASQRQPSYERGKLLVLTPGRADRSPHLRNPALKFAGRDPELSGGTFEQVALLHRRDG